MPEFQLQRAMDGLRAKLQVELDAQFTALGEQHAHALREAREAGEREAEARWAARLDATTREWQARLEAELAALRAEAERQVVAEATRARLDAEQAAAEAAARLRADFERELEAELQRVEAISAAERQRADADRRRLEEQMALEQQRARERVDEERQRAERALVEARLAVDAERPAAEQRADGVRLADPHAGGRLRDAIVAIGAAHSLSDILTRTLDAARAEAPGAALAVVSGETLVPWGGADGPLPDGEPLARAPELLRDAVSRGEALRAGSDTVVPLLVGGRPVAALHVIGAAGDGRSAGWAETLDVLASHASACLAYLTAVRTTQAVRFVTQR